MMAEKHISEYLGIIDPFLRKLIIGYFSSFTAKTILGLIESKLQKLKKERERKKRGKKGKRKEKEETPTAPGPRILTTCFCLRGLAQKVPSVCWNEDAAVTTRKEGHEVPAVDLLLLPVTRGPAPPRRGRTDPPTPAGSSQGLAQPLPSEEEETRPMVLGATW